jgi:hypothetical protein
MRKPFTDPTFSKVNAIKFTRWDGAALGRLEIDDMIRRCVRNLLETDDHKMCHVICGNTLVLATNYDDEALEVWVATIDKMGYEYRFNDDDILHITAA